MYISLCAWKGNLIDFFPLYSIFLFYFFWQAWKCIIFIKRKIFSCFSIPPTLMEPLLCARDYARYWRVKVEWNDNSTCRWIHQKSVHKEPIRQSDSWLFALRNLQLNTKQRCVCSHEMSALLVVWTKLSCRAQVRKWFFLGVRNWFREKVWFDLGSERGVGFNLYCVLSFFVFFFCFCFFSWLWAGWQTVWTLAFLPSSAQGRSSFDLCAFT